MEIWVLPILFLVLGMGLSILEIFFPSAGIFTFCSIAASLGAVLLGFRAAPGVGITVMTIAIFGLPIVMAFAFHWWPRTSFGKQVLLEAPRAEDVRPDDDRQRTLKGLVGRLGRAKCQMLPGGVVSIDGHSVDAVSEGMAIEAGQTVRVVKVDATRVIVRPVDEEVPTATAENPLERPINTIIEDPFGEEFNFRT